MPVLVDGNNLLHTLPPRVRTRDGVRRMILDQTRGERISVTVIFDGFGDPGAPSREFLGQVTLEYAGRASADDAIIARIPRGPTAKDWVVVTDDRELQRRARDLGASVRTVSAWINRRGARRQPSHTAAGGQLSAEEVAEWEQFFAGGGDGSSDDGRSH